MRPSANHLADPTVNQICYEFTVVEAFAFLNFFCGTVLLTVMVDVLTLCPQRSYTTTSSSCTQSSTPFVAGASGLLRSRKRLPALPVPSTPVSRWFNLSPTQRLVYNTRNVARTPPMPLLPSRTMRILSKSLPKPPLHSPTMRTHSSFLMAPLPRSTMPIHSKPLLKVPRPLLRVRTSHTTTPHPPVLLSSLLTTLATLSVQHPTMCHSPRGRTMTRTLSTVPRPSFHCLVGIKDNRCHNNNNSRLRMDHISRFLCEGLSITRIMF